MDNEIATLRPQVCHKSKQNILKVLDREEALRTFEIAKKTGKDKATVSHHLDDLEKLGIVKRIANLPPTIAAYSLSETGKKLVAAFNIGYLREEEELDVHVRQLASIASIDVNSEEYKELARTVETWYKAMKERLRRKPAPDEMYR